MTVKTNNSNNKFDFFALSLGINLFIECRISNITSDIFNPIFNLFCLYARKYSLDKEQTSYSDSLDALRLSLKGYQIE